MRTGHEKANRNDKAKKPDYWEDREVVPSYNPEMDFDPYTVRPLRVVTGWPLHRLLNEALLNECCSIADSHDRISMNHPGGGAKVYNPAIIQGACWVRNSLNHLISAVKTFRAQRELSLPVNHTGPTAFDLIDEVKRARSGLGRLFPLREYDKVGLPPHSYSESPDSHDPLNTAALQVLSEVIHLRSGIDFFLTHTAHDPTANRNV